MKSYDVVVIGGSAAGISVAITARRHYPHKNALVIRKEKQVLIPCGIPYIFGTVMSTQKNLIPDGVLEKNDIDLMIDSVVEIDRKNKTVRTGSGEVVKYDRLVIGTGSKPVKLPIPGIDKENVFVIEKDVSYLEAMMEIMKDAKNLVIVGGGFIGVEFADECRKNRDVNISVVELLPHCLMLGYDEFFCEKAEDALQKTGISIHRGVRVEKFTGGDKVTGVQLSNGKTLKADTVIVAIGSKPNVELARKAGLEVGITGALKVDKFMRTSDDEIFACGDCTESISFFSGGPMPLMLASVATMESRVAGANLFGLRRENPGEIGVFSTKIAGVSLGSAGLTERKAKECGFDVVCGDASTVNRHPGGMPGMKEISIKLVFNAKTGVLLGGQAQGDEAVGEFINTLSACIQHRMTADDIAIFQCGTHPALTASPIAYQLTNAAESALQKMVKQGEKEKVHA